MITMQVSMTVPAGTETTWEQLRREAHRAYPQQPGFLGARVLHDCDHPAHYVMQSDWETRADADRAVRTVGMPWRTRGLGLDDRAIRVTYFDTIDPLA